MSSSPFSEFKNEEHRNQGEEFIFSLGKFAIAFERMCQGMRNAIIYMLRSQGLKNQGMAEAVIGDTTSAPLQIMLGAFFCHMPNTDADDQKAVKLLLKEIKEITEKRNIILHSSWQFGNQPAETELCAATIRQRTKQNQGAVAEVYGFSAKYLDQLTCETNILQAKINRLIYCIIQSDFKVSVELAKQG